MVKGLIFYFLFLLMVNGAYIIFIYFKLILKHVNLFYLQNYFTNYIYFKILCIGKESREKDFHKNLSYIKPFFFFEIY